MEKTSLTLEQAEHLQKLKNEGVSFAKPTMDVHTNKVAPEFESLNSLQAEDMAAAWLGEFIAVKTYRDWKGGDLYDYLKVGDYVDDAMLGYFLNVTDPRTFTSTLVQMGEAYSHVNSLPTYATLVNDGPAWKFVGNCYPGENINRDF